MSTARNFFGGRIMSNRNSFDRINPKYVPPSRHAIFIRGFNIDIDSQKIRDFFQEEAKSSCGIDFTSYSEELRKLSIALRFESHDIAKDIYNKFNNTDVFGCRLDITWFKDLKKARDRMIDERRIPFDDHRMNYKSNRFDYDRRDSRDWSDNRKRFQPNNNYYSKSVEKVDGHSEASLENNKHSSDFERSRSKSTNRSDKSLSASVDRDRQSSSIKDSKGKLSKLDSLEKVSSYKVDLDDDIEGLYSSKVNNLPERVSTQIDPLMNDGGYKPDIDEKKKKKKKRKRRHMEHSGSQDSYTEPTKMAKYGEAVNKIECNQFPAIAGDINNWKQTASDSDDYLAKNNQTSKVNAEMSLKKCDRLSSEKNMKMWKLKAENIEKAYKKDSETYSTVIGILIRKAPELKSRLESLMKEILNDAGHHCVDSMREYISHLSDNGNNNNIEVSMSPASSGS